MRKVWFAVFVLLSSGFTAQGSVVEVSLSELRPTQAVISHQQVAERVVKYEQQPQAFIKDLTKQPLKTAVLGPRKQYYLTDGHHMFSAMLEFSPLGAEQKVKVEVTADKSAMDDASFWRWLQESNQTWLYDETGKLMQPDALPNTLGRAYLRDDPWRGAMYHLRGSYWHKPKPAIPFIEFYWANYLRQQPGLPEAPTVTDPLAYSRWLQTLAQALQNTPLDTPVGPNSETAKQMGLVKLSAYEQPILPALTTGIENNEWMAVIEIPAGSHEKWQINKQNPEFLEWEFKDGQPRLVYYLGYPANYGALPNTLAAKEDGGDGDAFDVIVLGEPLPRGMQLPVRIIGRMTMLDDGEVDDKFIAVRSGEPVFGELQTVTELQRNFDHVTTILSTWFRHYKGPEHPITNIDFDDRVLPLVTDSH